MDTWGGVEEQELDKRNQNRAYNLANKVSQLRSVAVDLELEAHEHNRMLDNMDGDFSSGSSLLGLSSNRLHGVLTAGRQNKRVMCYVAAAVVIIVLISYHAFSGSSV
ncbi:BET1-like protein [Hyalella azteca]|uniref:BET1-like protein n=1 Tax=Hyalella azteca TaxID=294128 RepID=A0A8B7PN66_HYAAZ|nr:BET1-like protein [Hyalella azteca]XP_018026795.1 BET1-like protein [Hyalella azteca]XP_018026796.1 BET1-like protein [Hyalella azteca]